MARYARRKSESGIYHIMLRGINRQDIFEDKEDRQRFIETIKHYKTVSQYEIYGYCLMSNHVHLLWGEIWNKNNKFGWTGNKGSNHDFGSRFRGVTRGRGGPPAASYPF